jgi:hypothetical protein
MKVTKENNGEVRNGPVRRQRRGRAVLFAFAGIFCWCGSPFFPSTGKPEKFEPLRQTPQGVITQLVESYEQQRIDLFQDLFPAAGTFRFYVSPQFEDTLIQKGYSSEPRDTLMQWTTGTRYYYWTQEEEISHHKSMFNRAYAIRFTVMPSVDPGNFRYTIKNGDTTNVEVLMTDGQIEILLSDDVWTIAIERQVFFLERAPDRLWVIRKWYDLGIQP